VLVHGSMDRSASFARAVAHIDAALVVRYDRRGYGRSVGGDPAGIDGHAEDLLAVIEEHATAGAVVIGHSLGGDIALAAATGGPDAVLAVGAFEAPMSWAPWWPATSAGGAAVGADDPGEAAERFLRRMIGDERWASLSAREQAGRRAEGPALVAELRSVRAGAPYDLAELRCPVRVGRGSETAPQHRRAAEELAALVGQAGGPDVVDGATHGAHRSHPEAFAAWVNAVLALSRGRAGL
jgi:pimeloyl-ACP methyl ester carboxylesterase